MAAGTHGALAARAACNNLIMMMAVVRHPLQPGPLRTTAFRGAEEGQSTMQVSRWHRTEGYVLELGRVTQAVRQGAAGALADLPDHFDALPQGCS